MEPNTPLVDESDKPIEAVVAVFENQTVAQRVAESMRGPEFDVKRVSRRDATAANEMPDIVYDEIESIDNDEITKGVVQAGAIGAGSGLLLLGVPGLNVVAPIAGALAGMFIGGVAGADEANRGIELPDADDYRQMLREGKSFVVIPGDEASRLEYATKLEKLGALKTYQHPPVLQSVREPQNESEN